MASFNVEGLDHVALGVTDLDRSERFYAEVLGLRRVYEQWHVPRFMLAGEGEGGSGVALFPADGQDVGGGTSPPDVRVLHVAFRVDRASFEAAQAALNESGIGFYLSDHGVCHSIYFGDPDGHELELTTYDV